VRYGDTDPISVAATPVLALLQAVKDSYKKLESRKH
jgi:hypothetical protein